MSSLPDSRPSANGPAPRVRLAKGQEVSLGCGSLILIALIVLIFGRGGNSDVEVQVRNLRSSAEMVEREVKILQADVRELKKAVDAQTSQVKALQEKLEKAKGKE